MKTNFESHRGDDYTLTLTFADTDITGYKIYYTLKENETDDDDDAVIAKTVASHSDPTNGITAVTLSAEETNDLLGTYYYDAQYKAAGGTIKTAMSGVITFNGDITRSTA